MFIVVYRLRFMDRISNNVKGKGMKFHFSLHLCSAKDDAETVT